MRIIIKLTLLVMLAIGFQRLWTSPTIRWMFRTSDDMNRAFWVMNYGSRAERDALVDEVKQIRERQFGVVWAKPLPQSEFDSGIDDMVAAKGLTEKLAPAAGE